MGIETPALSQNDQTNLIVWIFGSQSTVPPLCSSLDRGKGKTQGLSGGLCSFILNLMLIFLINKSII